MKRTRHGKPIGIVRAALRELRRTTRPLRRRLRGLPDPATFQTSVPLDPDDRAHKRQRWHVLVDLIHAHCEPQGAIVVDLGTFQGHSSAHIHRYCPQVARIYSVDIRPPDPARDRIRGLPRVEFILDRSDACAQRFADASVDLIFIDADHSEASVRKDLAAWLPKLKRGGVIAGHDYGSKRHPGVKRAVDAFFVNHPHPLQLESDRVWWTFR